MSSPSHALTFTSILAQAASPVRSGSRIPAARGEESRHRPCHVGAETRAAPILTLVVHNADGSVTRGESTVRASGRAVRRVAIKPAGAAAPPAVLRAIEQADVAALSPGSLFTSTIPALLCAGVPDALAAFAGPVVYAANIMTQPGETAGFTLSDHLRAITDRVGLLVSDVLVHSEELPAQLLSRYCAEGAAPVEIDHERIERLGVRVYRARLVPDTMDAEMRHDPERLAWAVHDVAAKLRRLAR